MLEHGPMLQPALPTVLRLRALSVHGYSRVDIAKHTTLSAEHIGQLRRDETVLVTARIAAEVERLYRLLSGTPGVNKRAIAHGRRLGYLDPLELEAPIDQDPVIDMVVIDRALAGERVPITPEERAEAVRVGARRGMLPNHIAVALNMNFDMVTRYMAGGQPKQRGPKKQAA